MNKTIKTQVSTAQCIQASKCAITGKQIYTLELTYPRVVHSQLLTHNVFSKNSSSTRAVPLKAAVEQILKSPAEYIWTAKQAGMQGKVIEDTEYLNSLKHTAMLNAIDSAFAMEDAGAHKQNAGRLLEPFQNIKIVLTSTEWENWDWLRYHEDAQGEIADLARAMKEARDTAEIMELNADEWHVPYVHRQRGASTGLLSYFNSDDISLTPEEATAISASVCAQISYRKADDSLEKATKMRGMLVDGSRVHASPFEHQATPIPEFNTNDGRTCRWPKGVTHMHRDFSFWSANFNSWIQHRQLIKNHDGANLT